MLPILLRDGRLYSVIAIAFLAALAFAAFSALAARIEERTGSLHAIAPDHHAKGAVAIDGDTFESEIALWPDLSIRTRIRIEGIDAPELKARCASERKHAIAARDALQFLLESPVRLSDVRRDKYGGRFVARGTLADGSDLAQTLISAGYGRDYAGGKRRDWCQD
jgi:micrococcal nuclease